MHKKLKVFLNIACTFALCAILVVPITSCITYVGFRGSGEVQTEQRAVSGVEKVSISAGINLYLEQTGVETLTIEAEENILPMIVTRLSDGNLVIRYERTLFGSIIAREPVNVYLTLKDLDEITASSGAYMQSELLKTESLAADLSSGSSGALSVEVEDLACNLSSGANLAISGKAQSQNLRLSSGASYSAQELVSNHADANVSSGGLATIHVKESLNATISSGGSVRYVGQPQITSNITSGGSLQNISQD